ncbi:MAG: cytochrome c oxidase subunit II [Haloarculaceae archaeon]
MQRNRVGLLALVGAALLAVAVEPAAAQTTSSTTESLIWQLNQNLIYVAVPITVLVEGILIYTVWRFRNREEPLPTQENRRLEITWTIATAIILLYVGVASYQVLAEPYVTADSTQAIEADDPVEIEVVAQRYSWTFNYNESNATSTGTLYLPKDRAVVLSITSKDWLHAFHVPGLGLKQDAFPGQHNEIMTKPLEEGTYQLYCAEYCGSGHSKMLGKVKVVSQSEYEQKIDELDS